MQFDVHRNTNPSTAKRFPYLLDVQADFLRTLDTRVVVPLASETDSRDLILTRLMPVVPVDGKNYVAVTPQMAGIAKRELGSQIENLSQFRTEIVAALDLLLTGV